jgi:hypothetical protein
MTVYLDLTREFNSGRLRAVLSGGQAVVLHRLAIMSKDGDWVVREDQEALAHVLGVLSRGGARYRYGAPLDVRWMGGGWSSHFQWQQDDLRVRADFCTRPARLTPAELEGMWEEQVGRDPPFLGARLLAETKKTNREKDYIVIGELARLMPDARDRLLYSRSAGDLLELARQYPRLVKELLAHRPLLARVADGREALEIALDAERRALIHANERRLGRYLEAARSWSEAWPAIAHQIRDLRLHEAHRHIVRRAEALLPTTVQSDERDP